VGERVDKLDQRVTVVLREGGSARWCYDITCVAHGRFGWLKGYSATRMRYAPYNFWYTSPITSVRVEPGRGGGYAVVLYFQPKAIKPKQQFHLSFSFDLNPTWDWYQLRFTEKILNDARYTEMSFLLPKGYTLAWSNRPPDKIVDAGAPLLVWALTIPNAVYQFDFVLRPAA